MVSGWICDAKELEVSFDGGPRVFVPYGSERTDTEGGCGDTDNGFAMLMNYNKLGDGEHTITLYVDGRVETTRTFTVVTLGEEFLRDVHIEDSGHYVTIELSNGNKAEVVWDEATQSFAIADYFTLDDLLGRWEFEWYVKLNSTQTQRRKIIYEFAHIDMVDGYPILVGKDPEGNLVTGGLFLKHMRYAVPAPPPHLTLPSFTPIPDEQFFIVQHAPNTAGGWLCAHFFMDIIIADDLPPGAPAEVLSGDLAFTNANESQCLDMQISSSNIYEVIHASANRIE